MIGIALLAIMMAIPLGARNGLHAISRETDYQFALRNARAQADWLKSQPYDRLPPRLVTVPADARIQLPPALVEGSVALTSPSGQKLPSPRVDARSGRIEVDPTLKGKPVVVDYRCYLPDQGEAHTVPARPPYQVALLNQPVLEVVSVEAARGERLEPLSGWRVDASGRLVLRPSEAGRVVQVRYRGGRLENSLGGRFLSEKLQPVSGPGPFKLLEVRESYAQRARFVRLSLLRSAP